jgi:hypothetical protein
MADELSGYSATLAGNSLGAFVGVQEVTVGGVTTEFARIREVSDTNRIPLKLPLGSEDGPITIRFTFRKTLYNTLRNAALARTKDTFTLTDSGSSTDVGDGYVAHCGEKTLNQEGESVFNVMLEPERQWAFTA